MGIIGMLYATLQLNIKKIWRLYAKNSQFKQISLCTYDYQLNRALFVIPYIFQGWW